MSTGSKTCHVKNNIVLKIIMVIIQRQYYVITITSVCIYKCKSYSCLYYMFSVWNTKKYTQNCSMHEVTEQYDILSVKTPVTTGGDNCS